MTDWPTDYPPIEDFQFVINETPDGDYVLSKLYEFIWDDILSPTKFGTNFKRAVLNGKFHDITYKKTDGENHAVYTIHHNAK